MRRAPGRVARPSLTAQVLDAAVADPGAVVPGDGQRAVVGLRRVCRGRQALAVQAVLEIAESVGVVPPLVV
jgi:hypothetical protein